MTCPRLKQTKRECKCLSDRLFSNDYRISDPSFAHLWTLFMAFLLMQVKKGFDTPIFNYILPFLYKSGMISFIYHKYGKSFIEIISLPASYAMRTP